MRDARDGFYPREGRQRKVYLNTLAFLKTKRKSVEKIVELEHPPDPKRSRYMQMTDEEFKAAVQKTIQEAQDLLS